MDTIYQMGQEKLSTFLCHYFFRFIIVIDRRVINRITRIRMIIVMIVSINQLKRNLSVL